MDSSKSDLLNLFKDFDLNLAPGRTLEEFVSCIDPFFSGKSYMNIDFNDIATLLRNSSVIDFTSVTVPYDNIGSALTEIFRKNLPDRKLANILFNLTIGDDFTMDHVSQISEAISPLPEEINVIWGMSRSETATHEALISVILGFN